MTNKKEVGPSKSQDIEEQKSNDVVKEDEKEIVEKSQEKELTPMKSNREIRDIKKKEKRNVSDKLESENNIVELNKVNNERESASKEEVPKDIEIYPLDTSEPQVKSDSNEIEEELNEDKYGQKIEDNYEDEFDSDQIVDNDEEIDDDEKVLEVENDTLIEREYLSSLLEQKDRLVYYHVENIYKDEKRRLYKNKLNLRKDPPVLVVRDDEENEVRFYLTENLTDELSETLKQVKRAYYGFSGPSDINMPKGFFNKVKYYIKNNPLKIIGAVVIVGYLIILSL